MSTHDHGAACRGRFRLAPLALPLLVAMAIAGCGPKLTGPAGSVRVSGKVTCGGETVPTGTLVFQGAKGGSVTARIGADGTFTTMLVPGDHTVAVNAKDGVDTMDEKGNPAPARSLVPEKYASGKTSGLTVTVTSKGEPLAITLDK